MSEQEAGSTFTSASLRRSAATRSVLRESTVVGVGAPLEVATPTAAGQFIRSRPVAEIRRRLMVLRPLDVTAEIDKIMGAL